MRAGLFFAGLIALCLAKPVCAQVPPTQAEAKAYTGLHRAAHDGDAAAVARLAAAGAALEARDANGRTPLHVAAFAAQPEAMRALAKAGADCNALDAQRYDMVTIAGVADRPDVLDVALSLGNSAKNVTSPYDGTALIAAAHLGHVAVVERLIKAGAPLDHVNNLGWTALMEAVVLGDGGARHQAIVRALLAAGANRALADRQGLTPLQQAERRGYGEIAAALRK